MLDTALTLLELAGIDQPVGVQGIPSLTISRGGRLWATWCTGKTPGEDANNYVAPATSRDRGRTWNERLVVDPDGGGSVELHGSDWRTPLRVAGNMWAADSEGVFAEGRARDIIGDREATLDGRILTFQPDPWGIAVWVSTGIGPNGYVCMRGNNLGDRR